jgi:hypothetical protein
MGRLQVLARQPLEKIKVLWYNPVIFENLIKQ